MRVIYLQVSMWTELSYIFLTLAACPKKDNLMPAVSITADRGQYKIIAYVLAMLCHI
jgi:hypothetical protein